MSGERNFEIMVNDKTGRVVGIMLREGSRFPIKIIGKPEEFSKGLPLPERDNIGNK